MSLCSVWNVLRPHPRRRAVFGDDRLVHLAAVDLERFGAGEAEADFVPADVDDGDGHALAAHFDVNLLTFLPREHQHWGASFPRPARVRASISPDMTLSAR